MTALVIVIAVCMVACFILAGSNFYHRRFAAFVIDLCYGGSFFFYMIYYLTGESYSGLRTWLFVMALMCSATKNLKELEEKEEEQ